MKIQRKDFCDGELVVYADYSRSEHAGAGGLFQIADVRLNGRSILNKLKIDQGRHYFECSEVAEDLRVNINELKII